MKKFKTMMMVCLTLLVMVAVAGLTKTEAKAAEVQKFNLVQTDHTDDGWVKIKWNPLNVQGDQYAELHYRKWGSGEKETIYQEGRVKNGDEVRIGKPELDWELGSSYEVWLVIYNDDAEYQNKVAESNHLEVVTCPGSNVTGAVQTAATATSATVKWNAVAGANCYEVHYRGDGVKPEYVTGTSITLKNLKKNQSYGVKIYPCRKSSSGYHADLGQYANLFVVVTPSGKKISTIDVSKKSVNVTLKNSIKNNIVVGGGNQYEFYKYNGKKPVKTITTEKNYVTYNNKDIAKNQMFKVRFRSYNTAQNGKKYYSKWSSYKYFSTATVTKSVKVKGKSIQVKWNKIKGASGYKVYASTKYGKGYELVATVKKGSTTSTTFKKYNKKALQKGKTYYVYVKPYYKNGKELIETSNSYPYAYSKSVKYKK